MGHRLTLITHFANAHLLIARRDLVWRPVVTAGPGLAQVLGAAVEVHRHLECRKAG
jgi:hypothetical protein